MHKKSIIIALIIIISGASVFFWGYQNHAKSQQATANSDKKTKEAITVTAQTVRESLTMPFEIQYPAVIVGDQEITLTAKTSGTITALNFDLGTWVGVGKQLITIDDSGNFSKPGDNQFKSTNIKQLEIALEKAEQSYKLAKRNYSDDDSYANKKTKEISELDLEKAKIDLKGALDDNSVVAPISGYITQRYVSLGDSISAGQTIAKISQTGFMKIQFYVNQEELSSLKTGMQINILEDGKNIPATITNVSPQADITTRRFLIEAKPNNKTDLKIGSVTGVSFMRNRTVEEKNWVILPLSAITVSQSENFIFINENGIAKKTPIEIKKISGETAQIEINLPGETQIVINGNKLIQDGDKLIINN